MKFYRRHKKSIPLNLRHPEGQRVLHLHVANQMVDAPVAKTARRILKRSQGGRLNFLLQRESTAPPTKHQQPK